jgi:hypothetical protein
MSLPDSGPNSGANYARGDWSHCANYDHSAKLTTDTALINYSLGRHEGCAAEELHTS